MKINPDYVPGNLEEAVKILKEGLTPDDIKEIKNPLFDALKVHFTVGMMLRNEWSLWEKDTILVKWFKKNFGIDHADDLSGLILDCLVRDIRGLPRREKEIVQQYLNHWKSIKEQEKSK